MHILVPFLRASLLKRCVDLMNMHTVLYVEEISFSTSPNLSMLTSIAIKVDPVIPVHLVNSIQKNTPLPVHVQVMNGCRRCCKNDRVLSMRSLELTFLPAPN